MIRPAGEWKSRNWDSYGIHSQRSQRELLIRWAEEKASQINKVKFDFAVIEGVY
jgi:hypothetical protein